MIRQYIGRLGYGKTLMMIADAWRFILGHGKEYNIVSNQPIFIKLHGGRSITIPPLSGQALIDAFMQDVNTLFLIDEAQLVFPAYKLTSISENLQARWAYMRKYGNSMLYTCQGYNHAHKRLRDLTNEVCKMEHLKIPWLYRFIGTYYEPERFDESKALTEEQEEKFIIYRRHVWFWQVKARYEAYDTLFVSTTTIAGDGITIALKQPRELGVKNDLYRGL